MRLSQRLSQKDAGVDRRSYVSAPVLRQSYYKRPFTVLTGLLLACTGPASAVGTWRSLVHSSATPLPKATKPAMATIAGLSDRIAVRAAGRGNPSINMSDGRELVTYYAG